MTVSRPLGRLLSLSFSLCVFCIQPLAAQNDLKASDAAPGGLVLKRTVRNVVLDVVVTGPNRKPVLGLAEADFAVTEDGAPQQILSFEPHDLNSAPDYVPPDVPELPPNTFVNVSSGPERGPLNVILYDMINTSMSDQAALRGQFLRFIRNKPLGMRFAVFVLYNDLQLIQGFTADENQLLAVLDSRKTWPKVPGNPNPNTTLSGLAGVAHFLAGLPGRKNLIWLTGAIPNSFLSATMVSKAEMHSDVRETMDTLARGQIAVYPIDIRGMVGANASGHSGSVYGAYATEDELADETGGRAIYNSNSVTGALAEVTETGSTYYTLSYAPTRKEYDGKLRRIHVTLNKPGYQLAYRRSYFGDDPDHPHERGAQQPADTLVANMQHGAPMAHEVFFSAHIHSAGAVAKATTEQMSHVEDPSPYRKARPQKPIPLHPYVIDYVVPETQFRPEPHSDGDKSEALEFAVAAFDGQGRTVYSMVQPIEPAAVAVQRQIEQTGYRVQQEIHIPVDAASIRLSVRNVTMDRIGSLEVTLPLKPEPQQATDTPATGAAASLVLQMPH
jgi:VWFA-related protein